MGRRATLNAKRRNRRILYVSLVVAIIAIVVVLALIINAVTNDPYQSFLYKPVPQSMMNELTGVSDSTLNTIGAVSTVNPPAAITNGTALIANGKPEVLYVGGEYCPYCAFERWGMIVALSRFGNFSGIEYMQSSATDVNPNTPTFTFEKANFTSPYITFVAVEEYNRSSESVIWHPLTTAEQTLVSTYSTGGIPFIDIGNSYVVTGVQDQLVLTTLNLSGQNWTKIAPQLNDPQSPVAQGIDGTANSLITAICKIDGFQPSSVCAQPYATITLAYKTGYTAGSTTNGQTNLELAAMMRAEPRWTS
ncbi:MAG: DUF929 domain-containing protein [Thaumarchaeota archaeon]|nr:DUF929 domain-containing protein [Nitrososphaerota archaeon]